MSGMGVVGLVGMRPGGACLGSSQGLRMDPHTQVIAEQTQSFGWYAKTQVAAHCAAPQDFGNRRCGVPST